MDYRNKTDGEIYSEVALRNSNPNMSLPREFTAATLEALNVEPIYPSTPPAVENHQKAVPSGTEKNSDGQWVYAWTVESKFTDTVITDSEGNETTITADEQLAKMLENEAADKAKRARDKRNDLLKETDHFGLSDVTMSDAMTTYRQALRDVPQQEDFPGTITWPTKP